MRFGFLAALALVGLRLAIGWHFWEEGRSKLSRGGFSSASFFQQSKGPLASFLHSWSGYRSPQQWLDAETTKQDWNTYRDKIARKFDFDESQQKESQDILDRHLRLLSMHFRKNKEEMVQYRKSQEVIDSAAADPTVTAIPSLNSHLDRNRSEISQLSARLVTPVRDYWYSLELQLHNLRNEQQKQKRKIPVLSVPATMIDHIVPYFTLIVGGLLLMGLFSRMASLAGALFLLMVIATQPPWVAEAMPVHSQLIEACGLLVIAGTGAGRLAGLDFFIHKWRTRRTSVE